MPQCKVSLAGSCCAVLCCLCCGCAVAVLLKARDSNAEIMASFYKRGGGEERSLRPVPEEAQGTGGSSKTGSGAGRITAPMPGEGQGTPTNGSELGVSARRACLPAGEAASRCLRQHWAHDVHLHGDCIHKWLHGGSLQPVQMQVHCRPSYAKHTHIGLRRA